MYVNLAVSLFSKYCQHFLTVPLHSMGVDFCWLIAFINTVLEKKFSYAGFTLIRLFNHLSVFHRPQCKTGWFTN